jgi:proliferating cell nuclear antigen
MEFLNEKKTAFVIRDKCKKDIFISFFQLIKNTTSQINLSIDKKTFHIQGMDKSHVCLFDLKLSCKWFHYYDVDKKYNLCFDTSLFHSIINIKSEDQNLIFYLENDVEEFLIIEFKTLENNTYIKTINNSNYNKYFKLPLLDYDYEEMVVPNTDYDSEFIISSKKINDILSQLSNFGDDINIKCGDDCIILKTIGSSVEMRVEINIDDIDSYSIVENEEVNLSYSLIYISKMCITNKLSNNIEFSLSNDCPMKINYSLDIESSLTFYIAPKLSDD